MLQRRKQEALDRANGTSRRASGWAGEKAARSWRQTHPPLEETRKMIRKCEGGRVGEEVRAWKVHSPTL